MYQLVRPEGTQIAIMNRDGGEQQTLTSDAGPHFAHSFASDNRRLAYAGYVDGVWNIYWIDRITREKKQVTHYTTFGSFVRSPAWRPGTEEMVYEYSEMKGNIDLAQLPPGGR